MIPAGRAGFRSTRKADDMREWHPLKFRPVCQERIWGGQRLAALFGRSLPPGRRIGESWEVCDRDGLSSVVTEGAWAGRTLAECLAEDAAGVWGPGATPGMRFPWLCKLLDAREDLSLQVHPPEALASAMGGEPKTELWYVAEAEEGAVVHVGVRPGTTPAAFEERARDGTVASLFHALPVRRGDALFLPSGRVHALGRGLVVFEIQQNSDTTYRVFDWNRLGPDGRPRALHLEQAMRSIDFSDTAPALVSAPAVDGPSGRVRRLVRHPLFQVDHVEARGVVEPGDTGGGAWMVAVVEGRVAIRGGGTTVMAAAGDFVLIPAALKHVTLDAGEGAAWLRTLRGEATSA